MKPAIHIMSHNNVDLLNECLRRIKEYTPFEYDLIITDDASDQPYNIPDATIIRMPRRSNCCNLRNVGMEIAKSDYVFWLDNDTMVEPHWYKPLLEKMDSDKMIGLTGSPKDSRLIRNPFLPLTQSDCMVEYEFAYDFNHLNGECDFITSYCILVRKDAYRPTYCYNMPTPVLDPDLGANIKANGYKVAVTKEDCAVSHVGSNTARPGGRNYLHYLSRNFTRWFKFWEPQAEKVFELYSGRPVKYEHNAHESTRAASMGAHGDFDRDFAEIPEQYIYDDKKI